MSVINSRETQTHESERYELSVVRGLNESKFLYVLGAFVNNGCNSWINGCRLELVFSAVRAKVLVSVRVHIQAGVEKIRGSFNI